MLGRRQRTKPAAGGGSTLTDATSAEDDYADEGPAETGGVTDEPDGGNRWEEDTSDEVDVADAEYDDDYDDEEDTYDEDDVADDEYDDDEYDDEESNDEDPGSPEPFTPPTFLEAVKQAFRPNRVTAGTSAGSTGTERSGRAAAGSSMRSTGRMKAQPATGTAEDARAVNLIDRRERMVGFVLSMGLFALAVLAYSADHGYKNHNPAKQADVRHAAVEVLLIFAVLGAVTLTATLVRRRALLGFILAFAGLALLQTLGLFGVIYLAAGGWLIFRAMKTSPRSRARQAGIARKSDAGTSGTGAGARGARATTGDSSARGSSGASPAATGPRSAGTASQRQIGRNNRTTSARGGPSPSGRYTPPKQNRRPPPAKEPDPPEPSNRLSAWLRK